MTAKDDRKEFLNKVAELSGEDVSACYQCGKCSAGCPLAVEMDILPNQIIRKVQLGLENELLLGESIWKCVSCMTCAARCPKDISLCNIIEALRIIYLEEYGDKYKVEEISAEVLEKIPQQALIAALRKFTN